MFSQTGRGRGRGLTQYLCFSQLHLVQLRRGLYIEKPLIQIQSKGSGAGGQNTPLTQEQSQRSEGLKNGMVGGKVFREGKYFLVGQTKVWRQDILVWGTTKRGLLPEGRIWPVLLSRCHGVCASFLRAYVWHVWYCWDEDQVF